MIGRLGQGTVQEPEAPSSEDTVEIVLTGAEQLELWRIAEAESRTRMTGTFMPPHDTYICRRSARIDAAATVCFALVVLGITIALGWHGLAQPPTDRALAPVAAIAAVPRAAPPTGVIQVANPFDAAEIFEIPAAISGANVQSAIADLLMERARERIRMGLVPHRVRPHPQPSLPAEDSRRDVVVTRLFGPNTVAAVPVPVPASE